jgi:hypothetical protein
MLAAKNSKPAYCHRSESEVRLHVAIIACVNVSLAGQSKPECVVRLDSEFAKGISCETVANVRSATRVKLWI